MQDQNAHSEGSLEKPELDYRKDDISTARLFIYIGGGFVLFTLLLLVLIFAFSGKSEKKATGTAGIAEQYISLRKQEDSIMTTTALTDSANMTYRIPIDSAMKLLLLENGEQSGDPTKKPIVKPGI